MWGFRAFADRHTLQRLPPRAPYNRLGHEPRFPHIRGRATHSEGNLVLATAVSASADCLVTRDRKLLALGSYQGVKIVSRTEFLRLLQPKA